jgi:hypothetical protein
MADFVFADGREVDFELDRITISEYRALFDPKQDDEIEFKTLAKASGMAWEEVAVMPLGQWQRFYRAFFDKVRNPPDDPN